MQVRVSRWGNGLGIRVPKAIADRVDLRAGTRVEVTAEGETIVISVKRPRIDLDDLLQDMTPHRMHEAFDWGGDLGREVVD
jgi:antitoxin MazE